MPPHNNDDFLGDDVEIRLTTDLYPERTIQRLYKSGSSKLLTMTLRKPWTDRMGLKPGDFVEIWLSPDSTQIIIQKVPPQTPKQFKEAIPVAADSDAAAPMLEQEQQQKS
jgi:bifunctional DNA-binding transcriptional regulator/antitoxin component of YhaV-PrlF toxin-antitoxin module